jgi:dTDP-4-dehydrorhamnose 3,5-epimerase
MKILETDLPGCLVIEPQVFGDARGFFYEGWNRERFAQAAASNPSLAAAGLGTAFVQSNVSRSARGVLRGLHYQWPHPQAKLVSVLDGEVWDVAVDIRRGSPSFGRWTAVLLSADNHRHFFLPEGFAHGFVVRSESALFTYLCSAPYDAQADAAIRWDDPALAVDWPIDGLEPLLSDKDRRAPWLAEVPVERLPVWQGGET